MVATEEGEKVRVKVMKMYFCEILLGKSSRACKHAHIGFENFLS